MMETSPSIQSVKHCSPQNTPPEHDKEPPKIDLLEIYIEKSRALGLG